MYLVIEFYHWSSDALILLMLGLSLGLLLQLAALLLTYQRRLQNPKHFVRSLVELFILLELLLLSMLHGQIFHNVSMSIVTDSAYVYPRIAVFLLLSAASLADVVLRHNLLSFSLMFGAAVLLPSFERFAAGAYDLVFVAVLVFYSLRAIFVCYRRSTEIRSSLSALSIKETIDKLNTAVLFCAPGGFILLINLQMLGLMKRLGGRIYRDGEAFYRYLAESEETGGFRRSKSDGHLVLLEADREAWLVTRHELRVKRRTYIQITATNISRRWALTEELRRQEQELGMKADELKQSLLYPHELSREQETMRVKMRAHDVLGQRLSILLRTIYSDQDMDMAVLHKLTHSLLDDMRSDQETRDPYAEIKSLCEIFSSVGVTIDIEGDMPDDRTKANLIADILRESVTNAVRHGFATEIKAMIEVADGAYRLLVHNNGYAPQAPIVEGSGISGMRRKVEQIGGILDVDSGPQFALMVRLPED